MNKKLSFLFAALVAGVAFSSCSSDEDFAQDKAKVGKTITLTLDATRGETNATRTSLSHNEEYGSLESVWADGDKIHVYSTKTGNDLGTLSVITSSIINFKNDASEQNVTSYAQFQGEVTLGAEDAMADDYTFVYQGAGQNITVSEGKLSYDISNAATDDIASQNVFDVAIATGKINGDAGAATAAVSLENKLAFGYFTTESFNITAPISISYYSSFTLDVKTGEVVGVEGEVTIPNKAKFFMPLLPGEVNFTGAWQHDLHEWEMRDGKWGYNVTTILQSKAFTATASYYYRLGKSFNYGPVPLNSKKEWILYETLKGMHFSVAADKTVAFTQGNLQYIDGGAGAANDYWTLPITQYGYLGAKNSTNWVDEKHLDGSYDLFPWGANPDPETGTLFFSGTTNQTDYTGGQPTDLTNYDNIPFAEEYDWGYKFTHGTSLWADKECNILYPGLAGKYRTLSKDEWNYLFYNRNQEARYAMCKVTLRNGEKVRGLAVFPDGVTEQMAHNYGFSVLNPTEDQDCRFTHNNIIYSAIENNGILFLPAAGGRPSKNEISSRGGGYWSSSSCAEEGNYKNMRHAYAFVFNDNEDDEDRKSQFKPMFKNGRYAGRSVRLVQDYE